jgi:Zn-finger nucleic acid-binding protein
MGHGAEPMISSRAVTIRQYCSVCKATLDMSVVDTVQSDEVTWLKCPRCAGILPHMLSRDEARQVETPSATATAEVTAPAVPAAIPEDDRDGARDYDSTLTYEVGEIVYHRSMNQYGRVVEKTQLPGNRSVIRIQFEAGEPITLREGQ